jgi:hypothetical protein
LANDYLAVQDDAQVRCFPAKMCRPERVGGGDRDMENKRFGGVSVAVLDDGLTNWEDGE